MRYTIVSLIVGSMIAFFSLFAFGQNETPNYFSDAKLQASINMSKWGGQWSASYNFSSTVTIPITGTTGIQQFIGAQYDAANANGTVRGLEFRIDPAMCPCRRYVLLWGTTGKLNGKQLQPNTVYLIDSYGQYSLTEWTWGSALFFKLEEVPTVTPTSTNTTVPPTSTPTATPIATNTSVPSPTATATSIPTVPAPTATATTQVTFPDGFRQAQIQAYLNQIAFEGSWKAQYGQDQANPIKAEKLEIEPVRFGNAGETAKGEDFLIGKCEALLIWGATGKFSGMDLQPNVVYYFPAGSYSVTNWTWGTYLVIPVCELYLPVIAR